MAWRRPSSTPGLIGRVRWGNLGRLAALGAAGLMFALVPRGAPQADREPVTEPAEVATERAVEPVWRPRDVKRSGGEAGAGRRKRPQAGHEPRRRKSPVERAAREKPKTPGAPPSTPVPMDNAPAPPPSAPAPQPEPRAREPEFL